MKDFLRDLKVPLFIFDLSVFLLSLGDKKPDVQFLAIDIDDGLIKTANEKMEEGEKNDRTKTNVTFKALDIMNPDDAGDKFVAYLENFNAQKFHIMFCFSITMWIHLNHGDEGLKRFIETARKWCDYLVLEPQPWKCYRNASRRMRRSHEPDFEHIESIEHKSDTLLPFIIAQCEKVGFLNIYNFGETSWKRPILLFQAI